MLIQNTVSDLLAVITTSATAVVVYASAVDTTTTTTVTVRQRTSIAAIVASPGTTILAAPAASTDRVAKYISITATGGANVVTPVWTDGTPIALTGPVTLAAGESLQYTDTDGWRVIDASGAIKDAIAYTALAANSFLANATAASAVPVALTVAAESIPVRTSGNLTTLASAVQTALIRAAGSLFFAAATAGQHLRRSLAGGDLGFSALEVGAQGTPIVANAAATNAVTDLSCCTFTYVGGSGVVGTTFTFQGWYSFLHTAAATPTLTAEIVVNGAVVATAILTPVSAAATFSGRIDGILTIRTTGAGGTAMAQVHFDANHSAVNSVDGSVNTATFAIDTTVNRTLQLRVRMTTAVAANTVTVTNGLIDRLS